MCYGRGQTSSSKWSVVASEPIKLRHIPWQRLFHLLIFFHFFSLWDEARCTTEFLKKDIQKITALVLTRTQWVTGSVKNVNPWLVTLLSARLAYLIPRDPTRCWKNLPPEAELTRMPLFYLATLILQKEYFNYFFFSFSKTFLLKFPSNEKYEGKILFSWVQSKNTQRKEQPKYLSNENSCDLVLIVFTAYS